jgi:DNA-directed RNA polymerase specialized sigma24 family protein
MGSPARALGRAAACARALRDANDDASFRHAHNALAAALRAEALRVLVLSGIPAQARDDLAQSVTVNVLDRVVGGAVEHGFEDGYVAVAAKNRARDWHRERSGVHDKSGMLEEDALPTSDPDPHTALEHAEEDVRMRALAERVARVLETAPQRYRDVLVAVYLEGVPIDALVEQELFREWPWDAPGVSGGDDPISVRRRARARVDKLLQRARDWMRSRLLAEQTSYQGGSP